MKRITIQNKADARKIIEALFKDQEADCAGVWQGMVDAGMANSEVYTYAIDLMQTATQAALLVLDAKNNSYGRAERDMTPEARYSDG